MEIKYWESSYGLAEGHLARDRACISGKGKGKEEQP